MAIPTKKISGTAINKPYEVQYKGPEEDFSTDQKVKQVICFEDKNSQLPIPNLTLAKCIMRYNMNTYRVIISSNWFVHF